MNNKDMRVLYLDLNSFFARVEQLDNPALRGRPVGVLPLLSDHTCCIAVSPEAKAFGIKTNTSVLDARRLCPDITFLPARHDRYVEVHHAVIAAVNKQAVISAVCSIDEMACVIPAPYQTPDLARQFGSRIKGELLKAFGPVLTASIGIASNRFLAKLASDMQKPDGLVVLNPADMPGPIWDLPIGDLCGIGRNMQKRLNRAGLWRVSDLWPLHQSHLRSLWGSVEGAYMWQNLHGYESVRPASHKHMVGHSRVLDPAQRNPMGAEQVTTRLVLKACQRLRRYNLLAQDFTLGVKLTDGTRWARQIRLHATDDSSIFLRVLHTLWGDMLGTLRPNNIQKVSIGLQNLSESVGTTGDLFACAESKNMDVRRKPPAQLSAALDKINKKFGVQTVTFASAAAKQTGDFVGTKIAFNRIPEAAEFLE